MPTRIIHVLRHTWCIGYNYVVHVAERGIEKKGVVLLLVCPFQTLEEPPAPL